MASTPVRILMTIYFYFVVSVFFLLAFITEAAGFIVLLPLMLTLKGFRRRVLSFTFQVYMEMDPWVVTSVIFPWLAVFVIKESLSRVPIAGWCLWLAEYVSVRFTKERGGWGTAPGAVKECMQKAAEVLDTGCSLVVFPEGTRSVSGRLQPFKDGFFRLAVEQSDVEVLPIGIHGTHNLWPVTSKLVDSGTVYVKYADPIRAQGMTAEALKEKTHQAIFDCLKASPDFDAQNEQPLTHMASHRGHGL
ncbi:Lysophosphatidic acid acyltransferase, related [Neospora caninum Liverpool]|uniref:Lysophosphatidic acid acyltransferase, related n=1 Tax=Neospora caninum (strain Liverpool) TaxID=572307 RepID=F0VDW6_NEOCL|nr:Lysophosphatidic acid acyltransferase, related [Neospora caninum Liverpool]CBZ51909.1 Lysophosphatidic acid acyltransferase, related [Neospora caninum Liverpool]|eukprot:XP_003881942.1 Lysophosphatidic acid acyltransferase, related [Neospora caninum Liverpool]